MADKNVSVLVAGGAGFVGSWLCEFLLSRGVKVFCCDNWLTGARENIASFLTNPNFFFVEHDINEGVPKNIPHVSYVLDVAGVDAYLNGEDISIETLYANSLGVRNLLDFSVLADARFLLASTIDIYSAKISSSSLASYFGLGRSAEGAFSHHEAKRFAEALVSEYVAKKGLDARVVRLGDVYGPKMVLGTGNTISRMIKDAIYRRPVEVLETEAVLYPVYVKDVAEGVLKAIFSSGTGGAIITLSGSATTPAVFAQAIKARLPAVQLGQLYSGEHLRQGVLREELLFTGRELISWEPTTSLADGVVCTVDWFLKNHTAEGAVAPVPRAKPVGFWEQKGQRMAASGDSLGSFVFSSFVLTLFIFLVWFFALPAISFILGSFNLYMAGSAWQRSNSYAMQKWGLGASFWFGVSSKGLSLWPFPAFLFAADTSAKLSSSYVTLGKVVDNVNLVGEVLLGRVDYPLTPLVERLSLDLEFVAKELSFLEAHGMDVFSFGRSSMLLSQLVSKIPELVGLETPRTYLVLFQNEDRIQASGGSIEAVGLLAFEDGRVSSFDVLPVYLLDKELKGYVEPPEALAKYGGKTSWFLKDANWDVEFENVAKKAAWFVEHETGLKVHGVVAVDINFVQGVFGQLGEASLLQSGKLSGKNLGEEVLGAQQGFFAEAIRSLFDQARLKLFLGFSFFQDLFSSFASRDIIFWSFDSKTNEVLGAFDWDGGLKNIQCAYFSNCVQDYVYVVESSLSSSGSLQINRSYSLDIEASNGFISHSLVVNFDNNLAYDYSSFLRAVIAHGSTQPSFILLNEGFRPEVLEVLGQEANLPAYGAYFTVPAGGSSQVVVSWKTPYVFGENGELAFVWQKQPGLGDYPARFSFRFPPGFALTAPGLLTQDGIVSYNTTLTQDILLNIQWQKQTDID